MTLHAPEKLLPASPRRLRERIETFDRSLRLAARVGPRAAWNLVRAAGRALLTLGALTAVGALLGLAGALVAAAIDWLA